MKHFEEVELIRNAITDIRSKIQDLQSNNDLFKNWLDPSIGALTCILESLYNTKEEMENHYNKFEKDVDNDQTKT